MTLARLRSLMVPFNRAATVVSTDRSACCGRPDRPCPILTRTQVRQREGGMNPTTQKTALHTGQQQHRGYTPGVLRALARPSLSPRYPRQLDQPRLP
jgi:hypothetical protein